MNTTSLLRASLAAFAAFALAAGCRTPPKGEADEYGEGEVLESEFPGGLEAPGDLPLGNIDFSKLAPVVPPAAAGIAPVYFSYNESAIPASEQGKVANAALFLMQNAGVVLLVAQGIDPARIQTVSYGEEKPAVPGSGESAWRLNRRGDFAFFQR